MKPQTKREKMAKFLLICGILSSVLYIGADIFAANLLYPGYSYTSQQVSELSAIGAPTRPLWIAMTFLWTPLVMAFSIGVWLLAGLKRSLRVAGVLLVAFSIIGLLWALVFPMHLRGTIETVSGSTTDTMHVVFAGLQVLVMTLFMAFGSGAGGKGFRIYSIASIVAMLVSGAFIGAQTSAIAAGQATPWMGLVERVSVYAPVLWVLVFAVSLAGGKAGRFD